MNWKKVKGLIESIKKNLQCNLHNENPCGTCEGAIRRDIEILNEEARK